MRGFREGETCAIIGNRKFRNLLDPAPGWRHVALNQSPVPLALSLLKQIIAMAAKKTTSTKKAATKKVTAKKAAKKAVKKTAKKAASKKAPAKKVAKKAAKKAVKKTAKKAAARAAVPDPSHEEIEAKAFELFLSRLRSGYYGDQHGDWREAERILSRKK